MYQETSKKIIQLYPYQEKAVNSIFEMMQSMDQGENILFQLPTGGGKTVIFSEIARKYLKTFDKKVLILTHRVELMKQTSNALGDVDVRTKLIDRYVRKLDEQENYQCFVAMVETLNNRLAENSNYIKDIGLVIVDEAHYNSFRKIFQYLDDATILGVTATPLSSNKNLPLKDNYKQLLVGESIASLIKDGYLSKATTYCYDVNLGGLKVGINGDYTVGSSERLYGTDFMIGKLVAAYKE
ncbi:MAG: DEAD/DEAH box helicase family protein, partial [Bacteroidia bacterium]|nr:DEAD/DEAH box helicase family protein [Bacteroidia bacterium]